MAEGRIFIDPIWRLIVAYPNVTRDIAFGIGIVVLLVTCR